MKTMTCNQLGGACEIKFQAETFEEMAELSKNHAMEMMKKGDQAHLEAMEKMKELMVNPEAMGGWFKSKQEMFDSLPSD